MSYQLIPNLIFFFAVLGIMVLILRRLPEAQNIKEYGLKNRTPEGKLNLKGIPAESFSKVRSFLKFWMHKFWASALEAKDLKPHNSSAYRIKKIFGFHSTPPEVTVNTQNPKTISDIDDAQKDDEMEILERIKIEPKNYGLYDTLGKLYLKRQQYSDAIDIYIYLTGHQTGNPDFHARLAQSAFHLKNYALSSQHFERSLSLDKMHPNRYYNLGLALECQEKWKMAVKAFAEAVEMEPKNTKYLAALEKARKQIE